ncbi:hypothetical protein [uncultured Aquimarina sp.]|uniref:hypothetical protein n=1 Tax=uncultured Aquimarina sp. TaxID=575652 RepID=UPI00262F0013|nr:hypothetical protein [uncultured Aquimarina sp.]
MDNLNVGDNTPIKLKVSVQTEAISMTSGFLYNSSEDETPYSNISPFDPTLNPGWKLLDKGNVVKDKIFRVITYFKFYNNISNEETFNLAIEQIKNTYTSEVKGGNPSPYKTEVTVESFYSTKTCFVESELKLI